MKFFDKLFSRSNTPHAAPPESRDLRPHVSAWYTYGMHRYRTAKEDPTVYYIDEGRKIRRLVVDSFGFIQNFPGVDPEVLKIAEVPPRALAPQIRFRTDFERRGNRILMLWQVWPDGRYWEDEDGFGAEPDEEVTLYAWLNENGIPAAPFRLYRVGTKQYFCG